MNEPNNMQDMTICTSKSLANMMSCQLTYTFALVEGEACHIYGVHSTHVGEVKDIQFISQLVKSLLIKWLGEYVG
jgi:hypothetical protein